MPEEATEKEARLFKTWVTSGEFPSKHRSYGQPEEEECRGSGLGGPRAIPSCLAAASSSGTQSPCFYHYSAQNVNTLGNK